MQSKLNLSVGRKAALGAAGLMLAASCAAFAPASAYAETAEEAQAAADAAFAQLTELQAVQEEKSNAYFQHLLEYQQAVDSKTAAQQRIDEIQAKITEIQGNLGYRARSMYRDGIMSFLDVLFGSSSFDDFAQTLTLLDRINQNDAANIQKSKDLKAEAQEQRAAYERAAQEAEAAANEASEAYEAAVEAVTTMQATYASLSSEAQALYAAEASAAATASQEALVAAAAEVGAVYNDDGTVTDTATGTTYSSASAYTTATGNEIVDRARAMIGSSYVWGGVGGDDGGFDCSGLVSYALTGENTRVGPTLTFMTYTQVDPPSAGDIIVSEGHTGIISGVNDDGSITVIHAIDESQGVQETTMTDYASKGYIVVSANG